MQANRSTIRDRRYLKSLSPAGAMAEMDLETGSHSDADSGMPRSKGVKRPNSETGPAWEPFATGLKGSIGDRANHSNFSHQHSVKILSECRKIHQKFSENF